MSKRNRTGRRFRPLIELLERRTLLNAAFPDFNGDGFDDLAVGAPFEDIGAASDTGAVTVIYGANTGLNATTIPSQFWHQNSAGVPEVNDSGDNFGAALGWGDFNGDGFDDLAIGVPFEDVAGVADAGAVIILYGQLGVGLTSAGAQIWTQASAGIADLAEAGDRFGSALSTGNYGDFNGAFGIDDLAIGVPFEDVVNVSDAGAVHVLYGTPIVANGLRAANSQFFTQNGANIADRAEAGDQFGYSLTSGNFNGDANDDLAIGVPFEDVVLTSDAGAVNVIYARGLVNRGLRAANNQFWTQNSAGVTDLAEAGDRFGFSLILGNFNNNFNGGNPIDDLAIGVPGEDVTNVVDAGAVNVLRGSVNRLTGAGSQFWHQNNISSPDRAEDNDQFGYSLISGDFDGDGNDDLAIGVPFEDISSAIDAGAVQALYGSNANGLTAASQFWYQTIAGVGNPSESGDNFGFALAAGNFNNDANPNNGNPIIDLAIGVPAEDVSIFTDAGEVDVLYGSTSNLSSAGSQQWTQGSANIPNSPEDGDGFGWAMAR